jgi:heme-degrading monooxygenase HmoA
MIARIWHGYTTLQNADTYEKLLTTEIIAGIQGRNIRGFHNIKVLRWEKEVETEFITIMEFDSLEAVKEFAGEDYEQAVVPEAARAVLSHFDTRSQHYEIKAVMIVGE